LNFTSAKSRGRVRLPHWPPGFGEQGARGGTRRAGVGRPCRGRCGRALLKDDRPLWPTLTEVVIFCGTLTTARRVWLCSMRSSTRISSFKAPVKVGQTSRALGDRDGERRGDLWNPRWRLSRSRFRLGGGEVACGLHVDWPSQLLRATTGSCRAGPGRKCLGDIQVGRAWARRGVAHVDLFVELRSRSRRGDASSPWRRVGDDAFHVAMTRG